MSRRSNTQKQGQKRDWRWYANIGLNGIVALSMVLGTVLLFTGPAITQQAAPAATAIPQSANPVVNPTTPTPVAPTPTPAAPTPTPKAELNRTPFASPLVTAVVVSDT